MMQLSWVEELGSGVLNVNKYWHAYSNGAKPQFIEGATFKIILPVSDNFFQVTKMVTSLVTRMAPMML